MALPAIAEALETAAARARALWRRWRGPAHEHLPAIQTGIAGVLVIAALAGPGSAHNAEPRSDLVLRGQQGLAQRDLDRLGLRLGPGGRLAVARLASRGRAVDAETTSGWSMIDLANVPTLFGPLDADEARLLNAVIPPSRLKVDPAPPFRLKSFDTAQGKRALRCLTEAVYFEAGRDTEAAQAAVAQVVLNRVRHPAYPHSVCGVVYQGAMLPTSCQFSFTCDGSLKLGRMQSYWAKAEGVARRALSGHVVPEVGGSTNYHADYVAPYWAPTLIRVTQVGPHIFYRWTGPLGQTSALTQRYSGDETNISQQVLASWDWRVQGAAPKMDLTQDVDTGAVQTAAAVKVLEDRGLIAKVQEGRVRALLNPSPRRPTPEEIKAVNARMAVIEKGMNPVKQPDLGDDEPTP